MKRVTTTVWAVVLGVLLSVVAALWFFLPLTTSKKPADLLPVNVELKLQNVKFTSTKNGEPVWTLTAAWAEREGTDGVTRAGDVKVVFYGQEESMTVLTANQGEILPEHSVIRVKGNVRIIRDDGTALLTDYLEYDEDKEAVTTDDVVHFTADGMKITGQGMYLDVKRRKVRIIKNVEAFIEEQ